MIISIPFYNYCFIKLSFISDKRIKELQAKIHFYHLHIYLCSYFNECCLFLHLNLSYCLVFFHFHLKDFHEFFLYCSSSSDEFCFCLSENALHCLLFLRDSFAEYKIIDIDIPLSFQCFECHPTAFRLAWFLLRSQLLIFLSIPCM